MAQTTVFRLPITAPKPTRYFLGPKMAGFPSFLLTNQFRFADADARQGMIDDVTGNRFALTKGAATADTFSLAAGVNGGIGGGLKLTGKASLIGPAVDVASPFTFIMALTAPVPAAGQSLEVMSLGEFPTRGLVSWLTATNPVPASRLHSANLWQSDRGNVGQDTLNFIQTPEPYVAKYGELEILMMVHKGNGLVRLEQRKAGARTFIEKQFNNIYWQGPTADRKGFQTMRVGSFATAFSNATGMIAECASFYARDLTVIDSEVQQWIDGAYALAALRGRS